MSGEVDPGPAPEGRAKCAPRSVHFIAGMSRGGTTWLARTLNQHSRVAAFGETRFWASAYVEPRKDGTYTPDQVRSILKPLKMRLLSFAITVGTGPGSMKNVSLKNMRDLIDEEFEGLDSDLTPGELFVRICSVFTTAEDKDVAIEKTPQHVNWIDRIHKWLPDSRFILMVREPYGFMLSYKHFGDRATDAPKLRRYYRKLYHPVGCALVWRTYLRASLAAAERHPGHAMILRTDEVRADPRAALERVQGFLELEPEGLAGRVPEVNTSFPGGDKPSLRPEDLFWMNLLCRKEIRSLGVEVRRAGMAPGRVLLSLVRLPLWGIWTIWDLKRRVAGSSWSYLLRWLRPV